MEAVQGSVIAMTVDPARATSSPGPRLPAALIWLCAVRRDKVRVTRAIDL